MSTKNKTQKSSIESTQNAPKVHQHKSRLPKTHVDRLKRRLVLRTFNHNGQTSCVDGYQVQIQFNGIRRWFQTGESNKETAAKKAKAFYECLRIKGWDDALKEFGKTPKQGNSSPTVGDYIREALKFPDTSQATLLGYAAKFRTLVAEVMHIRTDKSRHDHANGGHERWVRRVESVKLEKITLKKVQTWKRERLKAAGSDSRKQDSAKTTANSILRGSKALFREKVRNFTEIPLPNPTLFEEVELFPASKKRYKSKIGDANELVQLAKKELVGPIPPLDHKNLRKSKQARELAINKREAFKALLLALGAGLRRGEIDGLTWDKVDFANATITVEATEYNGVKTPYSEDDVDVCPNVLEELKNLRGDSIFVVESPVKPRPQSDSYKHYRCQLQFRLLAQWLRANGVDCQKPLHDLRKEFGSLINAEGSIYDASRQLRHNHISTTRNSYIDKKKRVVVSILGNPPQKAQVLREFSIFLKKK